MKGSDRQASVAHARERVKPLDGDPVRRALVAEEVTPTPDPHAVPNPLTVGYRSGPAHNVYAVDTAQRTRPPADHVVVAGIAAVSENLFRHRIESGYVAAHFTVGRKTEERIANVRRRNRSLFAYFLDSFLQYPVHEVYAFCEVVAGWSLCLRGDVPTFIHKTKSGLRASTIDAEIHHRLLFGREWMETPCTTRFTSRLGNGLSGV